MLFEIVIYRVAGNKRIKVRFTEITARDGATALERACVRFTPDREVVIRQIDKSIYPRILMGSKKAEDDRR